MSELIDYTTRMKLRRKPSGERLKYVYYTLS
jgi:hypothetical protein